MCSDNCSSEHACENCNKSTPVLTPVRKHSSNNHIPVQVDGISKYSVELDCDGCAYSTSNNLETSSPINSSHTNASYDKCSSTEHACERCGSHSAVNSDLNYHILNTHKNGLCRNCTFCGFISQNTLDSAAHAELCELCEYVSSSANDLNNHDMNHESRVNTENLTKCILPQLDGCISLSDLSVTGSLTSDSLSSNLASPHSSSDLRSSCCYKFRFLIL